MNRNERQSDSQIQSQLPEGVSLSDLRYLSPKFAPLLLIMKGWDTKLEEDVDGNPPKVSYTLSRPLHGLQNTENLAERIGVLREDSDKLLEGYSLEIKPDEKNENILKFNFTGFPTQQTLDIMNNLDRIFIPDHRALV